MRGGVRGLGRRLVLITSLSLLSVIALACSSKNTTTNTTGSPTVSAPTSSAPSAPPSSASPTPTPSPSATVAASSGLSGTWTGQYSGYSQGTFTLTWQQTGTTLSGTIKLTQAGFTGAGIPVSGTLAGNSIQFGSVGQGAVSYTGTVSGNSMSGTYQAGNGNGNWSASKSS